MHMLVIRFCSLNFPGDGSLGMGIVEPINRSAASESPTRSCEPIEGELSYA